MCCRTTACYRSLQIGWMHLRFPVRMGLFGSEVQRLPRVRHKHVELKEKKKCTRDSVFHFKSQVGDGHSSPCWTESKACERRSPSVHRLQ